MSTESAQSIAPHAPSWSGSADGTAPAPGLADPVFDAQRLFRGVLEALSRPGTVQRLPVAVAPPAPLTPWAGALALTLCDLDTPVWLDPVLNQPAVRAWLRFHAGCPMVEEPATAAFALIGDAAHLDDLSAFDIGPEEYPDRSTTVIAQVADLGAGAEGPPLRGPGIPGTARVTATGLASGFWTAWRDNGALYPQGVDVFLAAPDRLVGLPRSVMVAEG